jgi:hypothetical protein
MGRRGKAETKYLPCVGCAVGKPYLLLLNTYRFVTLLVLWPFPFYTRLRHAAHRAAWLP